MDEFDKNVENIADQVLDTDRWLLSNNLISMHLKNDLFVYNLNIEVLENGQVNITGTALTSERRDRVLQVVKAVQGVSDVNMSLFIRSTSW